MTARKKTKKKEALTQSDSTYVLKIVLYLVLGAQWLRVESLPDWSVPIPVGLLIGLWFASHDHFAIDRKIEYAVLLVASFVSFLATCWCPASGLMKITRSLVCLML